jgi:hypothetical protein
MTTTYTQILLLDVEPGEAAAWLGENDFNAVVSPELDRITVVFDNVFADHADDEEPLEVLLTLASEISYELGCVSWLVIVDADVALIYTVYDDGEIIDSYGVRTGEPPEGGDAEILADTFDAPKKQVKVIRTALNREMNPATESASARLSKLMAALGLPTAAIGYDYARLQGGDLPDNYAQDDLIVIEANEDAE